jgi:very-short-patch-repair endonuclease
MTNRVNPPLPTRTRMATKPLRSNMTDAERVLWYRLRGRRLSGLRFRRQHPRPPYVVDFYCHEARLVIELDGSQHDQSVDSTRTAALNGQGLHVLRFWDNQVLKDLESVLDGILRIALERTLARPCGAPSPGGRGNDCEPVSPRDRSKGEGTSTRGVARSGKSGNMK